MFGTGRPVDALRQKDCYAHRDQCRVHSLWTKHPSFCRFQRVCFVTIFQLRRVDKFSLAAAGRPQAASTQPMERYGFTGFRVVVRSFHASTLSLVLIHIAGITKQHMFALLQQAPAGVRAARSRSVRIGYAVRCVCQCFV